MRDSNHSSLRRRCFISLGIVFGVLGFVPQFLISPPNPDDWVAIQGVAENPNGVGWTRRGRKEEEIYFVLEGKKFACSTSLKKYSSLKKAIYNGESLTMLIDPKNGGALIGPLWGYWEIKTKDGVLVTQEEKLDEYEEGRFAMKIGPIVFGLILALAFIRSGIIGR